ncbi:MAG: leucine-rich repeat domain-containing protein [Methanomassiliicoccaceae archaeon]|jgi:hypothetical protein|nr:leucine-rich repeat domain-containing protein [Methanomassiliicoccaceae archaeon]
MRSNKISKKVTDRKRLLTLSAAIGVIAVVLMAAFISMIPSGSDIERTGDAGVTFADGDLVFEVTKDAPDGEVRLFAHTLADPIGDLVIPSTAWDGIDTYTVTSIADAANMMVPETGLFAGRNDMTSVVIPNTIAYIGTYAFYRSGAVSVDLGSVEIIERYAFTESKLESVTIPGSLKTVGRDVFKGCGDLTTVTMEGSPVIGENMFLQCYNLTSVDLGSVTEIGNLAFTEAVSLRSITIPNTATAIGAMAFMGGGLETVTIPPSVETIGTGAFNHNYSLGAVAIPAGTTLGGSAFLSATPKVYYDSDTPVTAIKDADGMIGLLIEVPDGKMIEEVTVEQITVITPAPGFTYDSLGYIDVTQDGPSFDPTGKGTAFFLSITLADVPEPPPSPPSPATEGPSGNSWLWLAVAAALLAFLILIGMLLSRKVVGMVTHKDEGVEGVLVEYTINGNSGTAMTDKDGNFIIRVPAGSGVTITGVTKEGHIVNETLPVYRAMEEHIVNVRFTTELADKKR